MGISKISNESLTNKYGYGATWSDSVPLSTVNYSRAYDPFLVADNSVYPAKLFAAWRDIKYGCLSIVGCGILGRISNDDGGSFEQEQRFDERPAGLQPSIAVKGKMMAVAWSDDLPDKGILMRMSTDNGKNWCSPYEVVSDTSGNPFIAISHRSIHVAWEQCIGCPGPQGKWKIFYRRGEILPTGIVESDNTPSQIELLQNYPNPFNPKTTLSFVIGHSSLVTVKIYNLYGQEVAMLVNKQMEAGEHSVEWNAEKFPSGMYFYRLSVTNEYNQAKTQVKKMILMK
jgi:hypothetical protein